MIMLEDLFQSSTSLCLLVAIACLLVFHRVYSSFSSRDQKKAPPGPKPLPLLGNLLQVDLRRPDSSLVHLSKIYGPVFTVYLGQKKIVVLAGYRTVREALVNHAEEFGGREVTPILYDWNKGHGKPFNNSLPINYATSNVISAILFGKRFEYKDPVFQAMVGRDHETIRLIGTASILVYTVFPWLGPCLKNWRMLMKNVEANKEELKRIIVNLKETLDPDMCRCFVDAFLTRKLNLKRLANIVPMAIPHKTSRDVTFQGFFIKEGTAVFPLLTSVLRDENEWESPNSFNPSHFLDENGTFIRRDAFMPFSAGHRVCLGESLARMELFLFFSSLLQRFRFTPPPGVKEEELDLTPTMGFNLSPTPHELCAISRQ
ncbi:Cytochrome P450 2K1 [Liparis tanakae]|uniref:Cytochrome P450 2K1 n=1 Tax=Liparis tanakae TaxID=230148 RepID=A0A4Z2HT64_9TELE|nr:Cytochrome P450 2K1 [Liparis tanakae]